MRWSFHICHVCSLWQGLSNGTINFNRVTLHVTFDLLLKKKNFNIGHNFFILRDRAFHIWHVCSLWQGLSDSTVNFDVWPWMWPLTFFWKTLSLPLWTYRYIMPCGALPDFVSILVQFGYNCAACTLYNICIVGFKSCWKWLIIPLVWWIKGSCSQMQWRKKQSWILAPYHSRTLPVEWGGCFTKGGVCQRTVTNDFEIIVESMQHTDTVWNCCT